MITFRTGIRIDRPMNEVFGYVSEPRNLPQWNSAVQAVRRVPAGDGNDVGATYLMERALATGTVNNELEIVAHKRPTEFALRTTSGPTPFRYRFRFTRTVAPRTSDSTRRPNSAVSPALSHRSLDVRSEEASTTTSQR